MFTKTDVDEGIKDQTELLSNRSRDIAVAILGLSWAFLISDKTVPDWHVPPQYLLPAIALALLTLVFDFAQYCFGVELYKALQRQMKREGLEKGAFEKTDWKYRFHRGLMPAKIACTVTASISLLFVLATFIPFT